MAETAQQPSPEPVFFQHGDVVVTRQRFVTAGQTFVMQNITSIGMRRLKPAKGFSWLLLLGCLGYLGYEINRFGVDPDALLNSGHALWMALALVLAFPCLLRIVFARSRYIVLLHTAGGELRALTSKDRKFISAVVNALNQAVVARG